MSFVRDYWVSASLSVVALLVLIAGAFLGSTLLNNLSGWSAYFAAMAGVVTLAAVLTLSLTVKRRSKRMVVDDSCNDERFWGEDVA